MKPSARLAALLLVMLLCAATSQARELNGFELDGAAIPADQILRGGPPRDGIPALTDPENVAASDSSWADDDTVIGVELGRQARAYPLAILEWHELVNDRLGGRAILVSYCPLCGTGMVFDRRVGMRDRTFGVSGLLYLSDLLLYDRETQSLWSQIESTALTGKARGSRLKVLRSAQTQWGDWKSRHPNTTVLSTKTGHRRDYGRTPYGGYAHSEKLIFPAPTDPRYHPKMPTLGLRVPGGVARAYPAQEVAAAGGLVEEEFAGQPIAVRYDEKKQVFDVEAPDTVEVIEGYWFAWSAFHPETSVFNATKAP